MLERFFSQFAVLPLDTTSARVAGRIRSELSVNGTPIDPSGLLIVAIALVNNLTLERTIQENLVALVDW
ncbi:hypothetical protein ACWATR_37635 [Nostoc sp. UIC 10890]